MNPKIVDHDHNLAQLVVMERQHLVQQLAKAHIVLVEPSQPDQGTRHIVHRTKDILFGILSGREDLRLLTAAHPVSADRRQQGDIHFVGIIQMNALVVRQAT